jgi:hypothetical protein
MEELRNVLITLLVCFSVSTAIIIPIKCYQDKEKYMASKGLIQCQNIGSYGRHWTTPEMCNH